MDTQVGLVALTTAGRGLYWVSLEASYPKAIRGTAMVQKKASNLAEPTGKCLFIITYVCTLNLPLISPWFLPFLDFWVSPHFRPSEILLLATVVDWGSVRPPCHRMDAIAPYLQQSTRIGSADGMWWVLAAFLVLFWGTFVTIRRRSFPPIQIIPFSPTFVSLISSPTLQNIRVWLLEGAYSATFRFVWRFIGRFQSTWVLSARKNGALQKKCFR